MQTLIIFVSLTGTTTLAKKPKQGFSLLTSRGCTCMWCSFEKHPCYDQN